MKKTAALLAFVMLFSCARAGFYTSNADKLYHADSRCMEGSTFGISEIAARQFEKTACPVCVDRQSVLGDIIEIPLPDGYLNLQSADFRNGHILLCGFVNVQNSKPYLAMLDTNGKLLQEYTGDPTGDLFRDACFLSDGRIALLRSSGAKWRIDLFEDNKTVARSGESDYLSRIWAAEEGFFVYGFDKYREYMLAKCDNNGNILWTLDMGDFTDSDGQPGLVNLLAGGDYHIVHGKTGANRPLILALDNAGNILGRTTVEKVIGKTVNTLYDESNRPVGYEEIDKYLSSFTGAAWSGDGVILTGVASRPGFAVEYGADGEAWFSDFAYLNSEENDHVLVDGMQVSCGGVRQILPHGDGYLLLMGVDSYTEYMKPGSRPQDAKNYMRIAHMTANGKITCDWFEDIGDIIFDEESFLFGDDSSVYLLVYGTLIEDMAAYEQGMTQPQIPRKMILKKII